MPGLIAINGKFSEPDEAKISADDRGFLYADSVFESLVGFGTQIIDIEPHLDRLRRSAESIHLKVPWSDERLAAEMKEGVERTGFAKSAIRLVVTRGRSAAMGLDHKQSVEPNRMLYINRAPLQPEEIYAKGISLKLVRRPFTLSSPTPKTSQYLDAIVSLREARNEGFDDICWMNEQGDLAESSTANLFLLGRQGDLVEIATPPGASGILLGITRATIIGLLERSEIRVTERAIFEEEIAGFDEGFVCSTVRGLVPLRKLGTHHLHSSRDGSVFSHINRLYSSYIESVLGYRVDWNSGEQLNESTVRH